MATIQDLEQLLSQSPEGLDFTYNQDSDKVYLFGWFVQSGERFFEEMSVQLTPDMTVEELVEQLSHTLNYLLTDDHYEWVFNQESKRPFEFFRLAMSEMDLVRTFLTSIGANLNEE